LRIRRIIWLDKFVDKIRTKHHVTTFEVEEVLRGRKKVHHVAKGDVAGEDVYLALGQTDEGRYLTVFFIVKANLDVLPISARDMDVFVKRKGGDMDESKRVPIPEHFRNAEEAGEFWDTHSAADYWDEMEAAGLLQGCAGG